MAQEEGWGSVARSVGEAQQSVHSQKREVNEREEELRWGKDALPKKYHIGMETGCRYFDEESLIYLSGDTSREQGVNVRCDILCPGVSFRGPKCVGWSQ